MKQFLIKPLAFSIAASALIALTGCGDATTTINEKDPILVDDDHDDDHDHDHDDDHGGGEPGGDAGMGRLFAVNPAGSQAQVFDLADGDVLASMDLDALPSAVYASGGYRFAALVERDADKVSFVDGGLWQEPHDDHFDTFMEAPALSAFTLAGSSPAHFVTHDGEVAVFFDGDETADNNAAVQVFDDHMVEEAEAPAVLELAMPKHGVAEPRGEHLLVSLRRDDAESTSTSKTLPDQVGVYHLHDGEYELEQTFEVACPDLHGAAQNETHVIFGCSDGVLLITDNQDDTYSAQKVANPDDLTDGLRIGSLWGHHESGQFIARASSRDSDAVQFFAIDADEAEIEMIDWQPEENAKPIASAFSFEAEQFVILDNLGHLTAIEPHEEDGHTHWEYGDSLHFTDADVSTMPDGMNFSMTFAQNGHIVYVADPIEQHILAVDLELLSVIEGSDIELDYAPAMITWLGIAEEHDH